MRVPCAATDPGQGPLSAAPADYFAGNTPGGVFAEFHSKIANLFIAEGQSCKVGIVDRIAPSAGEDDGVEASWESRTVEYVASNKEELDSYLEKRYPDGSSRTFIIQRSNSWSRMSITYSMFNVMCASTRTSPHFLKLVLGLGRKRGSVDEDFMGCYSSSQLLPDEKNSHVNHPEAQGELPSLDKVNGATIDNVAAGGLNICYNIRYFERHGRDLEDPWSCRQSAIHHSYDSFSRRSHWIVIQPPAAFASALRSTDSDCLQSNYAGPGCHSMQPHIQYLIAVTANWRAYLNYIAERLGVLDEDVAITKRYGEFQVDFSSKQGIHVLRRKLHHAASILENMLQTVCALAKHEETMAVRLNLPSFVRAPFQEGIQNVTGELNNHLSTTRKLVSWSEDIRSIYDDILRFHSQDLIQNNGITLTQLTQVNAIETRAMVTLADRARQESRTTRIATVVAVYYLPANLVLSFFSTTLVWFEDVNTNNSDSRPTVLRIHKEIWIAVLVTAILAGLTMAVSSWWERRETRGECVASPVGSWTDRMLSKLC